MTTKVVDIDAKLAELNGALAPISYKTRGIIEPFIMQRALKLKMDSNYHFWANYMYNTLCGDKTHFVVTKFNGFDALVLIKKTTEMTSRGRTVHVAKLVDMPISKANDPDTERGVFNTLFGIGAITEAYIPEHRLNFIDKAVYSWDGKPVHMNFIFDFRSDMEMFSNKYKTKYRINLFEKNKDFIFDELKPSDTQLMRTLYDSWRNWKYERGIAVHGEQMYSSWLREFPFMEAKQYVIRLNTVPIAVAVFVPTLPGCYYKLIQLSYIPKTCSESHEKILAEIGQILHYKCMVELAKSGAEFMSCAGGNNNQGLLDHKMRMTPRVINYYRVRRKDDPRNAEPRDEDDR